VPFVIGHMYDWRPLVVLHRTVTTHLNHPGAPSTAVIEDVVTPLDCVTVPLMMSKLT
jgi:hypothetical protein